MDESGRDSAQISTGSDSDLVSAYAKVNMEDYEKALDHVVLVSRVEIYFTLRPRSLSLPVLVKRFALYSDIQPWH